MVTNTITCHPLGHLMALPQDWPLGTVTPVKHAFCFFSNQEHFLQENRPAAEEDGSAQGRVRASLWRAVRGPVSAAKPHGRGRHADPGLSHPGVPALFSSVLPARRGRGRRPCASSVLKGPFPSSILSGEDLRPPF